MEAAIIRDTEVALSRGDLLAAHDLAARAIAAGEAGERIRTLQVLALARMGSTAAASALYERYRLADSADVDAMALGGRLLKDRALAAPEAEARRLFAAASDAYAAAHARSGSYFPAVNAASLALLAGDAGKAQALARAVLDDPAVGAPADYYAAASAAEALLIVGRTDEAAAALAHAAASGDDGARASTRRQLRLVGAALGLGSDAVDALLAPLRSPPVLAFAAGVVRAEDEGQVGAEIDEALADEGVRAGYGTLDRPGDILLAERLLARGGELNVVLPVAAADHARLVRKGLGKGLAQRYAACLAAARAIDEASHAEYVGDPRQLDYALLVAMGAARLRARHLDADAVQLRLGGVPAVAGRWSGRMRAVAPDDEPVPVDAPAALPRAFRAIVFSDFHGFSRLSEARLPGFWRDVMGAAGGVLARHRSSVLEANSWGDALFATFADVRTAAAVVLELQEAVARAVDTDEAAPGGAGMRFGVHCGPVFVAPDPITGRPNIFGTEVTRAARIEPVAPTGEAYVTQQFAALLALEGGTGFDTTYVGPVQLAKGYGELKMFKLAAG